MTVKEFVGLFYIEKNDMLKQYFGNLKSTEVGLQIDSLHLSIEQLKKMRSIIDAVLTDAMYTILLGLDGEASIGRI